MKIVHVCIGSHVFGEQYAYQDNLLPRAHKRLGHDVTIIAPSYCGFDKKKGKILSDNIGEKYIENGIKLIRLCPMLPCKLNQHFHVFSGLFCALEKEQPDLIFAHNIGAISYHIFPKFKKKHSGVRIVFDNHADMINSWHNKLSLCDTKFRVRNTIAKNNQKIAKWFYGVTPARCEVLNSIYGIPKSKIKLLPMGADDDEIDLEHKASIRNDIRQKYNITDDDFLIVTGGKIDRLKNIHTLLRAVNQTNNPHIKLLIFGNIVDDMKETFNQLNSSHSIFVGWVDSKDVYQYFFAADLVCFPGLHSVLWEQAVASRVPCAFSKIDGFTHVDIGGNCVFLEEKNSTYYQNIIEKIINNREYYNTLYLNANSDRANIFLYNRIAQQVIDDINYDK